MAKLVIEPLTAGLWLFPGAKDLVGITRPGAFAGDTGNKIICTGYVARAILVFHSQVAFSFCRRVLGSIADEKTATIANGRKQVFNFCLTGSAGVSQ